MGVCVLIDNCVECAAGKGKIFGRKNIMTKGDVRVSAAILGIDIIREGLWCIEYHV